MDVEIGVPLELGHHPSSPSSRADQAEGDALAGALRGVLDDIDPRLGMRGVTPLPVLVEPFTAPARFSMLLVGLFGGMGLLLASLAGYALVSRIVATRLREYGIRRALGAPSRTVVRGVLWTALAPALVGGSLGVLMAIPVARAIQGELFAVPALDPVSFASAPIVLVAAAAGAGALCVRRALLADPVEALRYD